MSDNNTDRNTAEILGATLTILRSFDVIVVNSSAGKDSQAMLDVVVKLARVAGVEDRILVAHADLGRVEWKGTRELAEEQANFYGVRFQAVSRPQGDLLKQIEDRGMWPSSTARYCTSDHKRGQIAKIFTALAKELRESGVTDRPVRILNCMGLRSQESPARAKKVGHHFEQDERATNGRRDVWTWLPILDWNVEEVWAQIKIAGTRHHPAYDLGMPRLSCVLCVFASRSALMIAGRENRELLDTYVELEQKIGHTFRNGFKIEEIRDALDAGEKTEKADDWAA